MLLKAQHNISTQKQMHQNNSQYLGLSVLVLPLQPEVKLSPRTLKNAKCSDEFNTYKFRVSVQ